MGNNDNYRVFCDRIIGYIYFMKNVSILVPEGAVLQAIADPQYCLSTVNQFLIASGKDPLFKIELVGVRRQVNLVEGHFAVHPDKLIHEVDKTDLIFIPALFGNMNEAVHENEEFIPWIVAQYRQGAEVASLCVGAFLLASTGLLDGKKCSTHWGFMQEFRDRFPMIQVQDGNIVTDENRIYSSGGAHSYWNLLLYLVEKYTDREMAILISKYFAIDIDRKSQSVFALFKGQKSHRDEAVRNAQDFIEKNIDERISVSELADRVALSRRSFERRFREATHNSVLEYIRRIKIEVAKRSFETSRKNINEVMYEVGYSDHKAFRNTFKKITGFTPVAYRNKYNPLSHG